MALQRQPLIRSLGSVVCFQSRSPSSRQVVQVYSNHSKRQAQHLSCWLGSWGKQHRRFVPQRPFSSTNNTGTPSGNKKKKIRILQFQAQAQAQAQASSRSTESLHHEVSNRKNPTLFSVDSETNQWVVVPTNNDTNPTTTTATTQPFQRRTETKTHDNYKDWLWDKCYRNGLEHFLPAQYPFSVSPGYGTFCGFNFVASVCGSAAMVLSMQSLLVAVGVGSSEAAPMAGALNWVMKDGIGQLGGVWFASQLGRGSLMTNIDSDPKRWRMVSSLCMDGATLMELMSPLAPAYFLPIASVANIGKNIGFLTASASRAALHQSLCRQNNLGDVTAKAGSQSIAASLIGTTLGIAITPLLGGDFLHMTGGFLLLSALHQTSTYFSLQSIGLQGLNRHRLHLLLQHYITHRIGILVAPSIQPAQANNNDDKKHEFKDSTEKMGGNVPTPHELAQLESFFPLVSPDDTHRWLKVGLQLNELCPHGYSSLERLQSLGENYFINIQMGGQQKRQLLSVGVTYLDVATGSDLIRGMLHAHLLQEFAKGQLSFPGVDWKDDNDDDSWKLIQASHGMMQEMAPTLLQELEQAGWKIGTEYVSLESGRGYRFAIQ